MRKTGRDFDAGLQEVKKKTRIGALAGVLTVVVVVLMTTVGLNLAQEPTLPTMESENIQSANAGSLRVDKTNGPIEIHSWEEFKNIGNTDYNLSYTMDADYILVESIKSDGKKFTPIGTKENPFTGTFDGKEKAIDLSKNPEIKVDAPYNGLFGTVEKNDDEKNDAKKSNE